MYSSKARFAQVKYERIFGPPGSAWQTIPACTQSALDLKNEKQKSRRRCQVSKMRRNRRATQVGQFEQNEFVVIFLTPH